MPLDTGGRSGHTPRMVSPRTGPQDTGAGRASPHSRANTVVIGDVHGCGSHLERLLQLIDRWYPGARTILVGDLFTKGPEPGRVVRAIMDRRAAGHRLDLVCGNHDLRLLGAVVRMQAGANLDLLPRTERLAIELLQRAGLMREATWILTEACDQPEVRHPRGLWTVMHAGIDPRLGIDATPDEVKIHLKAIDGEPNWWERYDGSDGLIVVGHRPVREAIILRDGRGKPYFANLDTGCAYGGALTAYCIEADQLLQVPGEGLPMPGIEVPSAFRPARAARAAG
jgi:bis(5'-nucleosyl)-tetraphosphatase (symmetrical)